MKLKKLFKSKKQKKQTPIPRLDIVKDEIDGLDIETRKVLNLLNYTKTSGVAYDGGLYDVGYHSFDFNNKKFKGQRDPKQRFEKVDIDFTGKTVLDIGCNQGGMLFAIADKIGHGVGIDFDSRMINTANRIKRYKSQDNLDFYVFDLAKENLEIINDFLVKKVDVCLLLSICMWIPNWKAVVDFCFAVSDKMIFESNGKQEKQEEQKAYLETKYAQVTLLSNTSDDDAKQKKRKLYLCHKDKKTIE
ncbi:class I SAM-dependent methyltransferase [Candidatus Uabimicrobium sp. HlEnr_7]|uniref:class I SAM-dependent methyltransferase n=1 Tax=Candidatus Uabimicrobium helgolandensis TaxID=3095367 RepID=UPI003555EFBA